MKYEQLQQFTEEEINNILASGDEKEIKILPLSIGEYCSNLQYAQDFCISLLKTYSNVMFIISCRHI